MDKERATRTEQVEHNGQMVWRYSDGSLRQDNGQLVAKLPGGAPSITSETAREMLALRHQKGIEAQLRGMARGAGIEIKDDDVVGAAATALEAYTAHLGSSFLKSESLRGMSDAYDKIKTPLVGDRREKQDEQPGADAPSILVLIAEWRAARERGDTVDGEVTLIRNDLEAGPGAE